VGEAKRPDPVSLVAAIFSARREWFGDVEERLTELYGPVALRSEVFAFDHTDYYAASMGTDLHKVLVAFEDLIDPVALAAVKHETNSLEADLARRSVDGPTRPVNVDPGYVSASKFVLATTKDCSHRVYLGRGIFAEVTLHYTRGDFVPWPWTYPDYHDRVCRDFLVRVRRWYLARLHAMGSSLP